MSLRGMWERVRSLARPGKVDDEIQREIQFHLDMEASARTGRGVTPDEARREAARRFGGQVQVREQVHDVRGMTFMDMLRQDVRFGLRTLRRSPGYTTAAVTILALGIGANTAMFSVLHGVLLAPLPFRDGHELVLVQQSVPSANVSNASVAILELQDYRRRLESVRDLVEFHAMSFTLLNQGEPDRVDTGVVSSNFFDMLGVKALHGRTFLDHEDDLGAEAVLMLSHRYWKEKFGGDPGVIGRVLEMNNRPHTVVGVLPDFPQYPQANDVYMPTSACPFRSSAEQNLPQGHRSFAALTVIGRLAPGASPERATTEIATVARTFEQDHPADYARQRIRDLAGRAQPLEDQLVDGARDVTWMLAGVTLLVLVIACANVANLALARTTQRGRELAVRAALGAGRGRLLRQLLTESLVLALVGGVLGIGVAWVSLDLLIDFVGRFTARTGQIGINGPVLVYSLVAALASGLVFGIAPALSTRRSLVSSMRSGTAGAGDAPGRQRLRAVLVVAQVAVSCALLVGASLLIESIYRLSGVPLGYAGDRVLTAAYFGNFSRATTAADQIAFNARILDRLRSTPGIEAAATTNAVPQTAISPGRFQFEIEGRPSSDGAPRVADPRVASDGYFDTLQVRLLSGRDIRPGDDGNAPLVAVINASMAKYWEGADPVGGRFRNAAPVGPAGTAPPWITVIGVAEDFRIFSANQEEDVPAQFYRPVTQAGFAGRVMVRTAGDPMTFVQALKDGIHSADPQVPVEEIQTLADLRNERLASPRLTTVLLTVFAVIATLITVVGLAGVIGTSVSQRTREFGVRIALGASPRSVLTLVLRQGLALVAIGLVGGLFGAFMFGEVLTTYLFDTQPTDLSAYVVVVLIFVAAGIVACAGPARRATSIDPLTTLKAD